MKLIKIDNNTYTVDKKYFITEYYQLRCKLASELNNQVFEVDKSFLTEEISSAEYTVEGNLINIIFSLKDIITEILISLESGEIKIQFDYIPKDVNFEEIETIVVSILKKILKPDKQRYCDAIVCSHMYQYTITGFCGRYYWIQYPLKY